MEELEKAQNAEVIIRSEQELMQCYKALRDAIRDVLRMTPYGIGYVQLSNLLGMMNTDVQCGSGLLKRNMQGTTSFIRMHGIRSLVSTVEHYLNEIDVMVSSYDKHSEENTDGL